MLITLFKTSPDKEIEKLTHKIVLKKKKLLKI